jgi:hypothetical protein
MPVSQDDIDALNAALASGERLVRHGEKTVEYRSVDEILKARNDLVAQQQRELGQRTGPLTRTTRIYHAGRGFD